MTTQPKSQLPTNPALPPAVNAPIEALFHNAHNPRVYLVPNDVSSIATSLSKRFPRLHETIRKICRKIENRRIVWGVKAEGCWLCCRKDLPGAQLHFHHLDPKTKKGNIADLMTRSTAALVAEIRKCRLICVHCHKKHHAIVKSGIWRTGGCYDL